MATRTVDEGRIARYEFDGLMDMLEYIEGRGIPMSNVSHKTKDSGNRNKDFYGKTWSQYVDDVRYGNAEECQMFAGELDTLEDMMKTEKDAMVQDVSGDILDIGAYLDGTPECFRRKTRTETKPLVRIAVDMGFSGKVKSKAVRNRAVGIAALVNELQQNGFSVDVRIVKRTDYCCSYNEVKGYEMKMHINCTPVDIGELSCLCHPCFQRRFCFSLVEDDLGQKKAEDVGYGSPKHPCTEDCEIVFAGSSSSLFDEWHYNTLESTKDTILMMLDKFRRDGVAIG